jgi:hypothetical protein
MFCSIYLGGRHGRDRVVAGFTLQLSLQSVPITTDDVSSNLYQGDVYKLSELLRIMASDYHFGIFKYL